MKKIIFSIIIAVAAVGCSKQQTERHTGNEILIGASVGGVSASKAPVDNWSIVRGLCIVRIDEATTPTNIAGTTDFITADRINSSTSITFATPQYYHLSKNTYLWGFYPAGLYYGQDAIEWTVDSKTDIMVTDKIYDAGTDANPIKAQLAFKHVLTQIKVICRADAGQQEATKLRWGKITSIKFANAETSLRLDKNNPTLWPASPETMLMEIPLLQSDSETDFEPIEIPNQNNTEVNAAGMFFPSTEMQGGRVFKLKVYSEKMDAFEVVVDLGAGNKLTAGKRHTVTLVFGPKGINIKSTIDDWDELDQIETETV